METSVNSQIMPLDYFDLSVIRAPDKKAAVCNHSFLTFSQLDESSNRLANCLIDKGIKTGSPIGLVVNKDLRSLVSVLAAWKVGCPFVPIDNKMPIGQIRQILAMCDSRFAVVNQQDLQQWGAEFDAGIFCVTLDAKDKADRSGAVSWQQAAEFPATRPIVSRYDQSLAYIMPVSGQGGEPKGVMISLENLAHFIGWCKNLPGVNSQLRALNIADFATNQAIMDIALMVGNGIEMNLFSAEKDPIHLSDAIRENRINIVSGLTSDWGMIFDEQSDIPPEELATIKYAFIGGATCPPDYLKHFAEKMPGAEVYSLYGAAEMTVYCLSHKFSPYELSRGLPRVPIGHLFPGHTAHLLTRNGDRTRGSGELIITGPQVMEGYLQESESEKIQPIYFDSLQYKSYLTGDWVEQDEDGLYYYVSPVTEAIKPEADARLTEDLLC